MPEIEEQEQQLAESTETVETKETAESAAAEQAETSEAEKEQKESRRKNGIQRRIDELTKKAHLAQAEAEFYKQKALQPDSKAEKADAKPSTEPDPKDYPTVEAYLKAVRQFDREQLRAEFKAELEQTTQRQSQQSEVAELQAEWSESESKAVEAHADYREVTTEALDSLQTLNGPAVQALAHAIQYSDAGPELLYHLGQNPEILEELAEMHPTRAVVALGRIEGSLQAKNSGEVNKAPSHTRAPKPPTPVRGAGTTDTGELSDNLPMDVWLKRYSKIMGKAKAAH